MANSEPGAPAGLDLSCESPNVKLTVSGATLSASTRPAHKTDGRWGEIAGTYSLVAGPVRHEGDFTGVRDADYAFVVAQSKTSSSDEVPVVRLSGGSPDGTHFILEWKTSASEQTSATLSCKGSLLTATAPHAP
jgi:hypothetical protein